MLGSFGNASNTINQYKQKKKNFQESHQIQNKENVIVSKHHLHHRKMVQEARTNSQDELESEKVDSKDDEEAYVQVHDQNHVATTATPEINQPSQELGLTSNAA